MLDLVAAERGAPTPAGAGAEPGLASSAFGDAGPILDAGAKDAYRRRLAEIEDDMDEGGRTTTVNVRPKPTSNGTCSSVNCHHAVGLGGRDRPAGSASERARASVTRAIRGAVSRIGEHHASSGTHLDRAVRTGTFCAYLPDSRASTSWEV